MHVEYFIGKVRKRLAMLGRIKKNINLYTAGTMYTSFVLPILDKTAITRMPYPKEQEGVVNLDSRL